MASSNTIIDLAHWAPPSRLRRVSGKARPLVEKLCPLMNRKVVDLQGNVVPQAASNGIANRSPNDPYGMQIHAEKLMGNPRNRKGTPGGILPYSKCPQGVTGAAAHLEDLGIPRSTPCEVAADGKSHIDNEHACKCIEAVIAKRKAMHNAVEAENEERINRLALMQERAAAASIEAGNANAAAANKLATAAEALAAALPRKGDKDSK
jgi:hypothetical protein